MNKNSKIYVAGHKGLVGSAIWKKLIESGYTNLIGKKSSELDLRDQKAVRMFFEEVKPEYVILAAAKVGGIVANNKYRADFINDNLQIELNIINESYRNSVKKLLFLGSTCIYPRDAVQPMTENVLLTSPLEYTNEPYAIAKIAGIKLCESFNLQYGTDYISVMPTNIYGPNDNFNLETSHVLPALLRKIYLGKCLENKNTGALRKDLSRRPVEGVDGNSDLKMILKVLSKYGITTGCSNEDEIEILKSGSVQNMDVNIEIWGTGTPRREFLWSEDLADACIFVMNNVSFKDIAGNSTQVRNTHLNIGTGKDLTISELADNIKNAIGFKGNFVFNSEKPDGTMKKLISVDKIGKLGWKYSMELNSGIEKLYNWYLKDQSAL
ncbi:MAG: GDP-L-fucose synthase [Bacteroidales bacterium]|nr:GDP-L-fucose synthase [Bacteroidales bacterium]